MPKDESTPSSTAAACAAVTLPAEGRLDASGLMLAPSPLELGGPAAPGGVAAWAAWCANAGRRLASALPGQCAVCHGDGPARVCPTCVGRFGAEVARCRQCAVPLAGATDRCGACVLHPPPFDATVAAFDYAYPWDRLVLSMKFHGALDLVGALAAPLQSAVRRAGLPAPHRVLPLPSSRQRLRERGFNPAWEIARRLPAPPARADPCLLLRVREAPHQLSLARDRRTANVRGAFALDPRRQADVAGRCVALVDDVMTTGATAAEAAAVLRRAGASHVQVWVVARARPPSDGP